MEALTCDHLRLADAVASRYRGVPGHDYDDVRQVARLGLVLAARRYREEMGAGFVQFAVPTIAGVVKRYLRDQSWTVRPPRSAQELFRRVRDERVRLTQRLGQEPSTGQLAVAVGVSRGQIAHALLAGAAMAAVPLEPSRADLDDAPTGQGDHADHDPGFARIEGRRLLAAALADATERDRQLLRLRFVDELSQAEIAARLGISQMHVSRLLAQLLARLRDTLGDDAA